jgi:uncharacterized membrane protein YhaH (DUF805 family)
MDIKKAIQTYYVSALKQYADFKGRTNRKSYWMFVLINIIIAWAVIAFDNILGTNDDGFWGVTNGIFNNLYSLVLLIPGLAIAIRRLHDVGEEGSKLFFIFIPIIGWIILLGLLIKEGDPVENKFGPVPPEEPGEPNIGGHPYTPNEDRPEEKHVEKFDVAAMRKEVDEIIAKKKKVENQTVAPKAKKVKWGRDRGAIDFTKPPRNDGKRKE